MLASKGHIYLYINIPYALKGIIREFCVFIGGAFYGVLGDPGRPESIIHLAKELALVSEAYPAGYQQSYHSVPNTLINPTQTHNKSGSLQGFVKSQKTDKTLVMRSLNANCKKKQRSCC